MGRGIQRRALRSRYAGVLPTGLGAPLARFIPAKRAIVQYELTLNPEVIICEEVTRLATSRYGPSLRAVILTGSLARGEGTFLGSPNNWRVLGDAEFLLAFQESCRLPSAHSIKEFQSDLERTLCDRGIRLHAGASAVNPAYFRALPAEIFTFELRSFGQVIWGDTEILHLIPKFSRDQISKQDAWHLLCNRILELLEVLGKIEGSLEEAEIALQYRTCKLYLDMATSFLVFYGSYQPTYRSRAQALNAIAGELNGHPAFIDSDEFCRMANCCTQLKLEGRTSQDWFGLGSCLSEAIAAAHCLWRWELRQLAACGEIADHALVRAWMKVQPLRRRARGWLSALRRSGMPSLREWPRWMRMALHSSPRYWIYAAASELFFQLPALYTEAGERECNCVPLDQVDAWLPLRRCSDARTLDPSWRGLARRIACNYHTLLETTRA